MIHKGSVQTVLGPVAPEALGLTLPHEHVLLDMTTGACSAEQVINQTESTRKASGVPEAGFELGEDGPGMAATWRTKWHAPICLENRSDIARNWFYYGNYKTFDIEDVIYEANLFKRHGGGCLVDQTSIGIGRDPKGLQQVSRVTGVHIVMATTATTPRSTIPRKLQPWISRKSNSASCAISTGAWPEAYRRASSAR